MSHKLGIHIRWSDVRPPEGDEFAAWVFWNMAPGMGPRHFLYMLQEHGSALEFFNMLKAGTARPTWLPDSAFSWAMRHDDAVAAGREELRKASAHRAHVVTLGSEFYPELLVHLPDAPPILYMAGRKPPQSPVWISMVGSRRASEYGVSVAWRFAYELARAGAAIVSGLARGIDAASHRGAIAAGGYTAGVLGCGIGAPMTVRLSGIVREVMASGCVISTFPIGFPASSGTFPARNRVISGMSAACILVEAAEVSGALITATLALHQNRFVYVVPGDITRHTARGPVGLMAEGACPIFSVDKVISDLTDIGHQLKRPEPYAHGRRPGYRPGQRELSHDDALVYEAVGDGTSFEDVQAATGLPAKRVFASLSKLELIGLVVRLEGLRFSRRPG
ncbi:MAG: DNA-processing protein DprA [Bacillota bacterium]|nr:DNA-protecting protein DprA [Bacillota bacterium]